MVIDANDVSKLVNVFKNQINVKYGCKIIEFKMNIHQHIYLEVVLVYKGIEMKLNGEFQLSAQGNDVVIDVISGKVKSKWLKSDLMTFINTLFKSNYWVEINDSNIVLMLDLFDYHLEIKNICIINDKIYIEI